MKRVAILGAGGYTGRELARLLRAHPTLQLSAAMSAREGVVPEPPELPVDEPITALDWKALEKVDGVFLCTPHGTSAELAKRALALGLAVVDLSADFRLGDAARHASVYKHAHPAPELFASAVYGLTEHARDAVSKSKLVANPGCYPTSVLLALKPLLAEGLVADGPIVADCKSGTSGAGKTPSARTHFGSVHDNFLAYGVGEHRHAPEIALHAGRANIAFVAHLLPVFRGILSTIYVPPGRGVGAGEMRACLREAYGNERFVRVFERGFPELDRVQMTNQCHLAVGASADLVVIVSAIDNLMKGAAGQALQNMNLVLGLDEEAGLS